MKLLKKTFYTFLHCLPGMATYTPTCSKVNKQNQCFMSNMEQYSENSKYHMLFDSP